MLGIEVYLSIQSISYYTEVLWAAWLYKICYIDKVELSKCLLYRIEVLIFYV